MCCCHTVVYMVMALHHYSSDSNCISDFQLKAVHIWNLSLVQVYLKSTVQVVLCETLSNNSSGKENLTSICILNPRRWLLVCSIWRVWYVCGNFTFILIVSNNLLALKPYFTAQHIKLGCREWLWLQIWRLTFDALLPAW